MLDISLAAIHDLQNRWEALVPTLLCFDALPMDEEVARLVLIGRTSFTDPCFVAALPLSTADMKPAITQWFMDFAATQDGAYEFDVDETGKLIPPPGLRDQPLPESWRALHHHARLTIADMRAMNEVKFGAPCRIYLDGQIGTFWEPRVPHTLHMDGYNNSAPSRSHLRETARLGALPFLFVTPKNHWRETLATEAALRRHSMVDLWRQSALEKAALNRSYAFLPRSLNADGKMVGTPHGSSAVERETLSTFLRWHMEWPFCRPAPQSSLK